MIAGKMATNMATGKYRNPRKIPKAVKMANPFPPETLTPDVKYVGPVALSTLRVSQTSAITVFMSFDRQGHGGPVWPCMWPCHPPQGGRPAA
jgi:hypothetical protein